jgi:hypothetical protein
MVGEVTQKHWDIYELRGVTTQNIELDIYGTVKAIFTENYWIFYFVYHLTFQKTETFRKLDLFLSSGQIKRGVTYSDCTVQLISNTGRKQMQYPKRCVLLEY